MKEYNFSIIMKPNPTLQIYKQSTMFTENKTPLNETYKRVLEIFTNI